MERSHHSACYGAALCGSDKIQPLYACFLHTLCPCCPLKPTRWYKKGVVSTDRQETYLQLLISCLAASRLDGVLRPSLPSKRRRREKAHPCSVFSCIFRLQYYALPLSSVALPCTRRSVTSSKACLKAGAGRSRQHRTVTRLHDSHVPCEFEPCCKAVRRLTASA